MPKNLTACAKVVETVKVSDGKYTVLIYDDGKMKALRYKDQWRDLTGDNLILALAMELQEERARLDKLERLANEKGGILLHDGSESGRCGLGLRPGNLVRTLREVLDQFV